MRPRSDLRLVDVEDASQRESSQMNQRLRVMVMAIARVTFSLPLVAGVANYLPIGLLKGSEEANHHLRIAVAQGPFFTLRAPARHWGSPCEPRYGTFMDTIWRPAVTAHFRRAITLGVENDPDRSLEHRS